VEAYEKFEEKQKEKREGDLKNREGDSTKW
jgi:hypothetical protein